MTSLYYSRPRNPKGAANGILARCFYGVEPPGKLISVKDFWEYYHLNLIFFCLIYSSYDENAALLRRQQLFKTHVSPSLRANLNRALDQIIRNKALEGQSAIEPQKTFKESQTGQKKISNPATLTSPTLISQMPNVEETDEGEEETSVELGKPKKSIKYQLGKGWVKPFECYNSARITIRWKLVERLLLRLKWVQ